MSWDKFTKLNDIGLQFENADPDLLNDGLKLAGFDFLTNPKSLVLTGPAGSGKTYFSFCLIRALLSRESLFSVRFQRAKSIDDEILANFSQYGTSSYQISKYQEIPYLFIDDFGVDRGTERTQRDYYDIIDYRWSHNLPTILSSNLDEDSIEAIYGARILSRLKDFRWIEFDSKDMRGSGINTPSKTQKEQR